MRNKLKEFTENLEVALEEISGEAVEFSLEQINNVKSHLKNLEDVIIKKQGEKKVKTLTISSDIHLEVKKYCVENDLKMCEFVEVVLAKAIKTSKK